MAAAELRRQRLPAASVANDLISATVARPGSEASSLAGMAGTRSPCSLLAALAACLLCVVDAQVSTFNGEMIQRTASSFHLVSNIVLAEYLETYLMRCFFSNHAACIQCASFKGSCTSIHADQKVNAGGSRRHEWSQTGNMSHM